MAIYRQVHTMYWQDNFILQLTPEEKYFYIYLLTNSKTKQCGIYQLPVQVIVFETGYNIETCEKLLQRFIDYGKIIYNAQSREIAIVNWLKYNPMFSPKTKACVLKELKEVKDRSLIDKIYPMQGVSQEEQAQEEEKEKEPAATPVPSETAAAACHSRENGNPITMSITQSIQTRESGNLIIPEDDQYDYNCHSLTDQAIMLFTRIWNKPNKNPEEYRLVSDYIITYGFTEVEFAFREAVKYNSRKLAYVEAICKKHKERKAVEKKKEEACQKKTSQYKDLTPEQRNSWANLHLLEMVKKTGLGA